MYDKTGITEEGLPRQRRDGNFDYESDRFDEFFSGNLKFRYQSRDISLFHRMSITYR